MKRLIGIPTGIIGEYIADYCRIYTSMYIYTNDFMKSGNSENGFQKFHKVTRRRRPEALPGERSRTARSPPQMGLSSPRGEDRTPPVGCGFGN